MMWTVKYMTRVNLVGVTLWPVVVGHVTQRMDPMRYYYFGHSVLPGNDFDQCS